MILILILISSLSISFILTGFICRLALKYNIVDDPKSAPSRKQQKRPIPLLGGLGFTITAVVFISILYFLGLVLPSVLTYFPGLYDPKTIDAIVPSLKYGDQTLIKALLIIPTEGFRMFWVLVSLLILSIVGYLDDKYQLSAKWQLLSMCVYIVIALLGSNLVISRLSYPFNELIPDLYWLKFALSFAWVFLCINATKILDGLDGLVGLVGFVGFILVAAVSFIPLVSQSLPAVIALIWAAAVLGFLPYNFPNAKLYLGEGGSEIVGFLLAIFSLWSGAKLATVSMGIGLFILDILLVVLLRLKQRRSPLSGDRLHWHHRLTDLGLSKIQVLAITAIFLVGFGSIGLVLATEYKIWLILTEVLVLLGLLLWSNYTQTR